MALTQEHRRSVIAAVSPLVAGAAPFNDALTAAFARTAPTDVVSWRRLYPPILNRDPGAVFRPETQEEQDVFKLAWHDPRTWQGGVNRVRSFASNVVIVPWLHPVMAPPYRYILRRVPTSTTRVVICHNVEPHEPVPGSRRLTRSTLAQADLLVTHAPHQREQLQTLGLDRPLLEAFHPRFRADAFGPTATEAARLAERRRLGDPDLLLLAFGAIRPYKGIDLALEALARVPSDLKVKLVVAGRSWGLVDALRAQATALGIADRVEFHDRFIPDEEAALLFAAADASLLPYRDASQSGVVQLSFAYGTPVLATRVGGLPAAVDHGRNGLLCDPNPDAIANAIAELAGCHPTLAADIATDAETWSFERYCALIDEAVSELRKMSRRKS